MLATKTKLRPYVQLIKKKTQLEEQLRDVKARLDVLEPQIAESFQKEGIQSTNVDGYTVYLNRQLWAGATDGHKEAMFKVLKAYPDESWSFLVKDNVNSQQLSARVRECEQDADGMPILPDELQEVIKVSEVFKIGARKSD